jgi:hypothetical protein
MGAIIQLIQDLIDQVENAGLPLNNGQINALTVKLEAAINQLSKTTPNIPPACGQTKAFVNQVEAFIQSNKITEAQGEPLIDDATEIRELLGCSQYEK